MKAEKTNITWLQKIERNFFENKLLHQTAEDKREDVINSIFHNRET